VFSVARTRADDGCPGALTLHQAADGLLARIRLPGGMITADELAALAGIATDMGSPAMELTSRGNVQIRGVSDAPAVAEAVAAAGLLPSPTHETVRNIVASPLSGRVGGHRDIRPLVGELDAAIQAEPLLATLPARFWFGIDDGRGDVSGLAADVGVHVFGDSAALLLAGRDTGIRMPLADAARTVVEVAARFAQQREKAWRIAELDDTGPLLAKLAASADALPMWAPITRPPVGWLTQDDGRVTLGAAVPLGLLQARTAEYLAATAAPIVITPWRSVLICDLDEGAADTSLRVLAPFGLVFDENSPWLDVSACTGSPGCEHSAADVRADAALLLEAADGRRHYVGCERACGSQPGDEVLVATGAGYRRKNSSGGQERSDSGGFS
jgi:precorrin-3B synthase